MFKISGILKVKNDTVQVSEKFSKRDFVLTDNASMYPQDILFQLTQDKCSLLDAVQLGSTIEVSFNLRGREWTSPSGDVKYFNTLDAWRIDVQHAGHSLPPQPNTDSPVASAGADVDSQDLPF